MSEDRTVWVVDDDRSIRWVMEKALTQAGLLCQSFETAEALLEAITSGAPDVVISDIRMPGIDGLALLGQLRAAYPELPVIITTAHSDLDSAVASYEEGAFEYLPKPFDVDEIVATVLRTPTMRKERKAPVTELPDKPTEIIGNAPAMQEVFRAIGRLAHSQITVLINGESGTGKELVARALHRHSPRKDGPFIALNMAAIPRELMESELFGHEKGSFTGATARRAGRFEQADSGTLFLDEVGDMPPEAQTRLLRVLQDGEYLPVGAQRPVKTNIRVIAATNQNLHHLMHQGLFREDLFYRLNVVPLRLPPLRERVEDIGTLVAHFQLHAVKEGLPSKTFTPEALRALKSWHWPGNVRELENLVRRMLVLHADNSIDAAAVEREFPASQTEVNEDAESLSESVDAHIRRYFDALKGGMPAPGLYGRILREVEHPLILATLEVTRGNQVRAADILGLNRNTLRKKIKDLNIKAGR